MKKRPKAPSSDSPKVYVGTYAKYNGGSQITDNSVRFGLFGTYGKIDGRGFRRCRRCQADWLLVKRGRPLAVARPRLRVALAPKPEADHD